MISLITLAHRVSNIRASYAAIHEAVFSMSLSRIKSQLTHHASAHCEHENTLIQLNAELSRISATILAREEIDLSATFDREFSEVMDEYIQALKSAIEQLTEICRRTCQENKGIEPNVLKAVQQRLHIESGIDEQPDVDRGADSCA